MKLHPLVADAAAVIFDFDGVLVDSEPLHEEAIKRVAATCGWVMTKDHFHQMIGKGDDHAFELLARDHKATVTPAQVSEMCEEKHRECLKLIREGRFAVQPGAETLVQTVSAQRPTAVCSGSRREVVCGMLEASGLMPFMRTVVTHEDVVKTKPDPEGYLLAATRLAARPEKCLVIEDSPTGIRAGKAAGMRVVAVEHSFARTRLEAADVVMKSIVELIAR